MNATSRIYKVRDLSQYDVPNPPIAPIEIYVDVSGAAIAIYDGSEDELYKSLDALCDACELDSADVLKRESYEYQREDLLVVTEQNKEPMVSCVVDVRTYAHENPKAMAIALIDRLDWVRKEDGRTTFALCSERDLEQAAADAGE